MARGLTRAQRAILENLRDGKPWYGRLRGRSEFGGATKTTHSLQRAGYIAFAKVGTWDITEAGKRALRPQLLWERVPGKTSGHTTFWKTTDGQFVVWVNGHPRDDLPEWAGARQDKDGGPKPPWLFELAGSLREAKHACEEHRTR